MSTSRDLKKRADDTANGLILEKISDYVVLDFRTSPPQKKRSMCRLYPFREVKNIILTSLFSSSAYEKLYSFY